MGFIAVFYGRVSYLFPFAMFSLQSCQVTPTRVLFSQYGGGGGLESSLYWYPYTVVFRNYFTAGVASVVKSLPAGHRTGMAVEGGRYFWSFCLRS